jgi:molybdenum cofactor guanylyltransferase
MPSIAAFVLAGGRSSRMGSDKALLSLGDQTLLERTLRMVSTITSKVRVVGPRVRYGQFAETVEDIYEGCGPLGGIHAALKATDSDLNLMLSVDMPLMSAPFLNWLIQQAANGREMITVPNAAGGQQPLCAVYRRSVLEAVEHALKSGQYKIGRLFAQVPTRVIAEEEITAAGFLPAIFRNVNTPEEFDELVSAILATAEPGEKKPQ